MSLLFKDNKKGKKVFYNFSKMNPHKYWVFLMNTFYIFVLILIIFSLYLFYGVRSEKIFQVELNLQEKKNLLNEDLLNQTKNLFDIKERKEFDINNNFSAYKDPSF